MLRFGKAQIGHIMRYMPNINKRLNKANDKCAEMMKDIIDLISN